VDETRGQECRPKNAAAVNDGSFACVTPSMSVRNPTGALRVVAKLCMAHSPGAIITSGRRNSRTVMVCAVSFASSDPFAHRVTVLASVR